MSYEKAPRPKKLGKLNDLYGTIEELGGGTLEQVAKYVNTSPDHASYTQAQVKKGLYNGVYRGYFIVDTAGYYRIAPRHYYDERYKYVGDLNKSSYNRRKSAKKRQKKQPTGITVATPVLSETPQVASYTGKSKDYVGLTDDVKATEQYPDELTIHIPYWIPPFAIGLVVGGSIAASLLVITGVQ